MAETLIIVGAGASGVSTALAAIDVYDEVYLIDDPSPSFVPASKGPARIVRASYEHKAYERLASQSLQRIMSGQISKYFHESRRHVLQPGGTGSQRKTFREINFEDLIGEYDDQPAGRIDAADALECLKQMAEDLGVVFISNRVMSLVWDGDTCAGVRTDDGSIYPATKVLLAMGYRVPEFLASQGKPMEDGLCKTAMVAWGEVQLNHQQYKELKESAITIVPGVGEYLQGTEERIFVNNARTVEVTNLEQVVREYPLQEKSTLYKETHDLFCWFLPKLKDASFILHYCLDLITANQHFLIRPVPACHGLYIACGFSFHGFKFIEVIGHCIIAMMEGNLDPELRELWCGAINRNGIHEEVMPHRKFGEGGL